MGKVARRTKTGKEGFDHMRGRESDQSLALIEWRRGIHRACANRIRSRTDIASSRAPETQFLRIAALWKKCARVPFRSLGMLIMWYAIGSGIVALLRWEQGEEFNRVNARLFYIYTIHL